MPTPSDEARALLAEAPPVDLHADPLLWARLLGYDLNRRHRPPLPLAWFGGHVDVPRLVEAGVGTQVFGVVTVPFLDADLEAAAHRSIDLLEEAEAASEGRLVLGPGAPAGPGRVRGLIAIEGAQCLGGDLAALERFAARGLRSLGLVHLTANECGSPQAGPGARDDQGLTPFGRAVVARCEELGVLVDLAHLNRRGFDDALAQATRPPLVSHTAVAGVKPLWRNVDDAQLRAVAERGGVVGVLFVPHYLGRDGLEGVVAHLRHVVDVAGEDAAALGSDWDGFVRPTRGLEEPGKLPSLVDALRGAGLSRRAVAKILRGNAARLLEPGR